jgi:transcription elongation factor Elf1
MLHTIGILLFAAFLAMGLSPDPRRRPRPKPRPTSLGEWYCPRCDHTYEALVDRGELKAHRCPQCGTPLQSVAEKILTRLDRVAETITKIKEKYE